MNNLFVNIRFGLWHFQIDWNLHMSLSRNIAHVGFPYGRFDIYDADISGLAQCLIHKIQQGLCDSVEDWCNHG